LTFIFVCFRILRLNWFARTQILLKQLDNSKEEANKNGNPFYEEGYGEVTLMEKKKGKKKKK